MTGAAHPLAERPVEWDQTSCHAWAANLQILVCVQPAFHKPRNDKQQQIFWLTPRYVEGQATAMLGDFALRDLPQAFVLSIVSGAIV